MSAPPPRGGGMSLYANLLEPKADASASISRAPVVFKQPGDSADSKDTSSAKKPLDPALRFQPIRRPQQPGTKPKPKPTTFPKAASASTTAVPAPALPAPAVARTSLADWAATEDDEYMYGTGEKRQRGGRKQKKKKAARAGNDQRETDWDELYDPTRPTNVEEYLRSEERIREIREWKAVLYAHRRRKGGSSGSESGSGDERAGMGMGNQFAPPSAFAPPASYGAVPPPLPSEPPHGGAAPAPPPDDSTGDDAYARRLALSGMAAPPPQQSPSPPPPPPPPQDQGTISRAPVRYEAPPSAAPPEGMDIDDDEPPPPSATDPDAAAPRASRPGQAGFATRLMARYGWTKGSGLGAEETGITSALRVQVEKRKKRSDAEGGGYAEPGGRGKIIGGKKKGGGADGGKFGSMSDVILLQNMLEGMQDLAGEIEQGLGQEIGEECGEKYGRVERLYIDVEGKQVFIKFTDQVSALRAVNSLDGRIFNGNTIAPRFYDPEKFENGIYR